MSSSNSESDASRSGVAPSESAEDSSGPQTVVQEERADEDSDSSTGSFLYAGDPYVRIAFTPEGCQDLAEQFGTMLRVICAAGRRADRRAGRRPSDTATVDPETRPNRDILQRFYDTARGLRRDFGSFESDLARLAESNRFPDIGLLAFSGSSESLIARGAADESSFLDIESSRSSLASTHHSNETVTEAVGIIFDVAKFLESHNQGHHAQSIRDASKIYRELRINTDMPEGFTGLDISDP
jgi:hypothetical protein